VSVGRRRWNDRRDRRRQDDRRGEDDTAAPVREIPFRPAQDPRDEQADPDEEQAERHGSSDHDQPRHG
jgi:hypothetical protein